MNKKQKLILVDMTCSILHHGHIRILKKAAKYGKVVVALTSDKEIEKHKKFKSLLNFSQRKEILSGIKYVYKVIKAKFLITDEFLKNNKIDFLVHGQDNLNKVKSSKIKIFKKTNFISSTLLRKKLKIK